MLLAAFATVIVFVVFSAIQALRAARLLYSAIWLGVCSALTALLMYLLGAQTAAVIELSVGAGLVTILFVFAITSAGEEASPRGIPGGVPPAVAGGLIGLALLVFAVLFVITSSVPAGSASAGSAGGAALAPTFGEVFWKLRASDALLQVVIIFAGTLAVLGLIGNRSTIQARDIEGAAEASSAAATDALGAPGADMPVPAEAEAAEPEPVPG